MAVSTLGLINMMRFDVNAISSHGGGQRSEWAAPDRRSEHLGVPCTSPPVLWLQAPSLTAAGAPATCWCWGIRRVRSNCQKPQILRRPLRCSAPFLHVVSKGTRGSVWKYARVVEAGAHLKTNLTQFYEQFFAKYLILQIPWLWSAAAWRYCDISQNKDSAVWQYKHHPEL